LPTPLEDRYKFRANIRPTTLAYFVREDDTDSLIRILRFVSTQWGGIRNLIIPVKPDITIEPMFEYFLQYHEPDEFVEYLMDWESGDYKETNKLILYLNRLFSHRSIHLQHSKVFEEHDHSAHALSVINDDDLRDNVLTTHEFDLKDMPEYIGLALYGAIFPSQEKLYSDLVKLETNKVSIGTREFWRSQFDTNPFSSVLNLTSYLITPYATTSTRISNHFDVMLVSSITSLCMYWNCRAFRESVQFPTDNIGRRTFLLPIEMLPDKDAFESLLEVIRESVSHPLFSANKHIFFFPWNDKDLEQIKPVLSAFDSLEFSDGELSIENRRYREQPFDVENLTEKKLIYSFGWLRYSTSYHEGIGPELPLITSIQFPVSLNYGDNEVHFNPPPKYTNRFGGSITLDLECDVWNRYPRGRRVSESIRMSSWFSRYGLSGITYTPSRASYVNFKLIDEWESLCLFFESKGYKTQLSKDGIYADAVVNLLGGLRHLELLASKQTYLLLELLALKSTKKIAQQIIKILGVEKSKANEIEQYFKEIEIAPELKGLPKTYSQLRNIQYLHPFRDKLLELLNRLSEAQVIKRGFYLECPHCGAPDWYPLLSLSERVLCSGCSNEFSLPVEMPKGSEIQWQYRLNTLINRAVDQDVLPNILALYHTTKNLACSCLTTGIELVKEDRVVKEFDFLFVSKQKVYAGECKAGVRLESKDMETAILAAQLGFAKFYFCTVREFNEASLRQIDEVKNRIDGDGLQMSIEILTGKDLLGEPI